MVTGERYLAALACVLGLVLARDAGAFCRSTTCDPDEGHCRMEEGCVAEGAPLHWNSRCLSFGMQKDGSPLRHISYQAADDALQKAFLQWKNADCGGGAHPSIEGWDIGAPYGGIVCDRPEFNSTKPNANVVMFRDHDWPHKDVKTTLAVTSTIFDDETGALLDADIEINSYGQDKLTTTSVAAEVGQDLQSILTHEMGHFLGLAHSNDERATMFHNYQAGDLNYRSLQADDIKGICTIYPPKRDAPACLGPSPPHGFSLYCGGGSDDGTSSATGCACSVPGASRGSSPLAAAGAIALGIGLVGRRKTGRRNPVRLLG